MSRANRFRPFCSERCQMVDLGSWAAERYRIPDAESTEGAAGASSAEAEPPDRSARAERPRRPRKTLH